MNIDKASPTAGPDDEYAWFRDGSVAASRDDRIAEVIALIALLFSLGVGLVIALLPVSAEAGEAVVLSLERSALKPVPTGASGTIVLSVTVQ